MSLKVVTPGVTLRPATRVGVSGFRLPVVGFRSRSLIFGRFRSAFFRSPTVAKIGSRSAVVILSYFARSYFSITVISLAG